MKRVKNPRGQAALEFLLATPLLFLLFFGILQMAYMGFVSLAVQRASLAVARKATLDPRLDAAALKAQLFLSLAPLAGLSPQTLLTLLESDVQISVSPDKRRIVAKVRYPMPLWVPLVRNFLGEPLRVSSPLPSAQTETLRTVFSILHKPFPEPSLAGGGFPVRWITFTETTFNEGYRRP